MEGAGEVCSSRGIYHPINSVKVKGVWRGKEGGRERRTHERDGGHERPGEVRPERGVRDVYGALDALC